jgi:glycosyltransferase involved in cell wall biosynthesis
MHYGRFVHPMFREQLHATPPGWRYAYTHPALDDDTVPTKRILQQRARFAGARARAEHLALFVLGEAGYVHRVRARALPGASIIHSCERLLRRSPLPYVLDLEHADLFVLYQQAALERPWARALLERALLDDRLRFVLPWTDAARRSLMRVVSQPTAARIEPKLRVVMPSIRIAAKRPHERHGTTLHALFIGTKFVEKGGVAAFRALREARKTHDVVLEIVTDAPPEWAARLRDEPGIVFHPPGSVDLIRRVYSEADVLLFPSHMDSFGYVAMEAAAHGLPVIAPRHLALQETIADGVAGLLFAPENMLYGADTRCRLRHSVPTPDHYIEALSHPSDGLVRRIGEALVRLAEEPGLYARLAQGAYDSVASGHFSTRRRKAQLAEIYDAAAA